MRVIGRFGVILAVLAVAAGGLPASADAARGEATPAVVGAAPAAVRASVPAPAAVPVAALPAALSIPSVPLAVGDAHACALVGDGVRCWGSNAHGQLGDGTKVTRGTPAPVLVAPGGAPLAGVKAIAAGGAFTCALLATGRIRCWGAGSWGQLGYGGTADRLSPVPVAGITTATALAAGGSHACARLSSGGVKCWGRNSSGQLGDGTLVNRKKPVAVKSLAGATTLVAGASHACARISGGTVKCWGLNSSGQLGDGTRTTRRTPVSVKSLTRVTALAAGSAHTCARTSVRSYGITLAGAVKCWGRNSSGQLHDRTKTTRLTPVNSWVPVLCTGCAGPGYANRMAAGADFTCAEWSPYGVECAGSNAAGQLAPKGGQLLNDVRQLAAGGRTACAYASSTTVLAAVWCWGANGAGQVGDGTTANRALPVRVLFALPSPPPVALTGVVGVSGGPAGEGAITVPYGSTCAVRSGGSVACWGANGNGELGDGTTIDRPAPVDVFGLTDATAVSVGGWFACALRTGGTVACWGANSGGELGNGTRIDHSTPVQVTGLPQVVAIAAGMAHTCALSAAGDVYCWGNNWDGQLGNGTTSGTGVPLPVQAVGLHQVLAISAGWAHTCALRTDGSIYCWGANYSAQLGAGVTSDPVLTPQVVPGISGASGISAGSEGTCAIVSGGAVKCWGWYGYVLAGLNPTQVVGLSGVSQVSIGADHVCALVTGRTVRCWGTNGSGQLGDGTTTDHRTTPLTVSGLSGVTFVTAGWLYSCATADPGGTVYCWGDDSSGQLGDGLHVSETTPVPVVSPS